MVDLLKLIWYAVAGLFRLADITRSELERLVCLSSREGASYTPHSGTPRHQVAFATLEAYELLESVAFRSPIWHRSAADRGHCR
jgi:hypothetical protein